MKLLVTSRLVLVYEIVGNLTFGVGNNLLLVYESNESALTNTILF